MKYFNTLIEEKGISREQIIEVEGKEWGVNFIPVGAVVDFLSNADHNTQRQAKDNLVKIDFNNGDVMHFFTYVAKFMAQ